MSTTPFTEAAKPRPTALPFTPRRRPGIVGPKYSTLVFTLAPAALLMVIFLGVPAVAGIVLSFSDWHGIGDVTFVGFDSYVAALTDSPFFTSLALTARFASLTTVGIVVIATLLAAAVSGRMRGSAFYRVVWFLPGIAPIAAIGVFWSAAFQPNQGVVTSAFGSYTGTDRGVGLRWLPFWMGRSKISLRVRNMTSETLKVNDRRGNPVEIAANIVWRVEQPAQSVYDVEDYLAFVRIQVETALREVARQYAYDSHEEGELSLQNDSETVGAVLKEDLQTRVGVAGLIIDEAHLMHLAYAPEIASSMLRRQQAEAILAARRKIVLGAVDMVESALGALAERGVVHLDDDRRAAMVSNLLVVLCADREPTPVVNTGTLYG